VLERTCAGLALTASYWTVPAGAPPELDDPVAAAALAEEVAAAAAALAVRCQHPGYLPTQRRAARGRRD
jgi:hypothetical protein